MIDRQNLPKHIAIIMDGNGRWAKKRHLPKLLGHRAGAKTVDRITEACARIGIEALTLYSFSTENWKRSAKEVEGLMGLLFNYLEGKYKKLQKNNIRLNAIGRLDELPPKVRTRLFDVIKKTSKNTKMTLTLALNYGGRSEIVDATRKIGSEIKEGRLNPDEIQEDTIERYLYTNGLPEVDLLIRTSGELRISNFLLWQISYAEIVVTKTLWPDFRVQDLQNCIEEYTQRERRFGARLC
ncbi:MAG: isoprenyl transferase [Candidatus Omnitrophica bacterium]|nr:isoprenyl transferase [Candidatus Omnitrophota bacterium]